MQKGAQRKVHGGAARDPRAPAGGDASVGPGVAGTRNARGSRAGVSRRTSPGSSETAAFPDDKGSEHRPRTPGDVRACGRVICRRGQVKRALVRSPAQRGLRKPADDLDHRERDPRRALVMPLQGE